MSEKTNSLRHELRVQDPSADAASYLLESLAEAGDQATGAVGVFAFASRNGVDMLLGETTLVRLLGRGVMTLVVGIDAITDRNTLEHLAQLSSKRPNLQVRVFWNNSSALFHPKMCYFRGPKRHTAIIGSGNLTPGGLRDHFEAYSVTTGAPRAMRVLEKELSSFLDRHRISIRPIDEKALARAALNRRPKGVRAGEDIEPDPGVSPTKIKPESSGETALKARVLLAELPKGGDRWQQANFDMATIASFFKANSASSTHRLVFLNEVGGDGTLGRDEVRPCVLTKSHNLRIQLGAHRGDAYPSGGRPIAAFRELKARHFAYRLLLPGEQGYERLQRLLSVELATKVRRRTITMGELMSVWKGCPLGRLRSNE